MVRCARPVIGSRRATTPETRRGAISQEVLAVWRSKRILPLALLVGANGLLFMGPYIVLCPLIVRDIYKGGLDDGMAPLSNVAFGLIGTMIGPIAGCGTGRAPVNQSMYPRIRHDVADHQCVHPAATLSSSRVTRGWGNIARRDPGPSLESVRMSVRRPSASVVG